MNTSYPLISCLCITYNRVKYLERAIRCFQEQSYPNKELIITYKETDQSTHDFVQKIQSEDTNIIGYKITEDEWLTLGDVRNKAIAFCNGDYFCNWDDDDWYNTERLINQFEVMYNTGQTVSLITNILIYDELEDQAYFSAFRFWEMSILCKKSNINNKVRYASLQRSEDSFLVMNLLDSAGIYPTVNPSLIIYFVHGNNTMNRPHFTKMFKLSQRLSDSKSKMIKEILSGVIPIQEGSRLLNSKQFIQELNYFYKKAGFLTFTGFTLYGNRPEV